VVDVPVEVDLDTVSVSVVDEVDRVKEVVEVQLVTVE
jgi:hypothetical protein